ncbi:MAG: class I SAM-dependent methyltransferase [Phycisphaeraceae bacterium]|nr:class I SAM-dependent methyltransferase [Phycisphaeraceae bacterium]MCW5753658.1 class I SAM-dependent methyltransferase [Phycisphaeraceae bacterium]
MLDFGCASGRVLRHFACQADGLEVWGCDISPSHVAWVRRHLPPSIKMFDNHALPSLPLEDNSFDLVYAFSVFSHLDEHELGWLLELRRILRPGGFAYLTTHTDHTWSILKPEHGVYQGLLTRMEGSDPPIERSPEMFKSPLPAERVVFWAKGATVYGRNVFHSTDYIRATWGRFFEISAIHREGAYYQDVILLRKPA